MGLRTLFEDISNASATSDLQSRTTPDALRQFDASQYSMLDPKQQQYLQAIAEKKLQDFLMPEANQKYSQFLDQYQSITGTADPRFMSDQANREELIKAGLQMPETGKNPILAKSVQDFIVKGRDSNEKHNQNIEAQKMLVRYQQRDPEAIAWVAANPQAFSNLQEIGTYLKNNQDLDLRQREATDKATAEQRKMDNTQNFRSSVAMVQTPMERTGKYMPLGEASELVQQAASNYPVPPEEVNKVVDNLRLQYENTPAGPPNLNIYGVGRNRTQVLQQDMLAGKPQITKVSSDTTPVTVVTGGQGAQKPARPLPVALVKDLNANDENLRRVEKAITATEAYPDAFGWKNYAPDAVIQRADPEGIDARAAVGDLGSLIIRDRSGAAVTAAEFPRLKPFIPTPTDDPATVKKKLVRFREVLAEENDAMRSNYEGSGYNVPEYRPSSQNSKQTQKQQGGKQIDTSRPVRKGNLTGYRQPDGRVLDASGKRLN